MHIDSHYAAEIDPHLPGGSQEFSPLEGDVTAQTCVIGAGFAGLTTARELARAGHEVVVLDAERVGWGASGRNGGFVSSGFSRSMSSVAKRVGWQEATELYRLSVAGREYVRDAISELGLEKAVLGRGWLKLLRHDAIDDMRRERDITAQRFEVELQLVEKPQLGKYVNSSRYFAGLHDAQPFHIQPLQYARALAHDINQRGGRIFENSRCERLEQIKGSDNWRWRAVTKSGTIKAQNIVLATSAYGGPSGPSDVLNRAMIPIATYVVSCAPGASATRLINEAIPFGGCLTDTRRAGDYYRAFDENGERRLIWGGRITTLKTQPARLAVMLKQDIENVYPSLSELKIERAWSGLMGYATHKMPIVSSLGPGLWAAAAFGGHGLNTCAMAGQLVSAAISNGDDTYRRFDAFGPRWSGGIFGRLATQLEYWRLQFLDRLDERG